jgi:hypothetical protein
MWRRPRLRPRAEFSLMSLCVYYAACTRSHVRWALGLADSWCSNNGPWATLTAIAQCLHCLVMVQRYPASEDSQLMKRPFKATDSGLIMVIRSEHQTRIRSLCSSIYPSRSSHLLNPFDKKKSDYGVQTRCWHALTPRERWGMGPHSLVDDLRS